MQHSFLASPILSLSHSQILPKLLSDFTSAHLLFESLKHQRCFLGFPDSLRIFYRILRLKARLATLFPGHSVELVGVETDYEAAINLVNSFVCVLFIQEAS